MTYRPQSDLDPRAGNAFMAARIMQMPVQPYVEGNYVTRVLEAKGRKSGVIHQTPLAVVQVQGRLYLVSPVRLRSWVQNLLRTPVCVIIAGPDRENYRAKTVDGAEAIAALRTYLPYLEWVKDQFPFSEQDSDETILSRLDQVAVFHLERL